MAVMGGFNALSMGADTGMMVGTILQAGQDSKVLGFANAKANMDAAQGENAKGAGKMIKDAASPN